MISAVLKMIEYQKVNVMSPSTLQTKIKNKISQRWFYGAIIIAIIGSFSHIYIQHLKIAQQKKMIVFKTEQAQALLNEKLTLIQQKKSRKIFSLILNDAITLQFTDADILNLCSQQKYSHKTTMGNRFLEKKYQLYSLREKQNDHLIRDIRLYKRTIGPAAFNQIAAFTYWNDNHFLFGQNNLAQTYRFLVNSVNKIQTKLAMADNA